MHVDNIRHHRAPARPRRRTPRGGSAVRNFPASKPLNALYCRGPGGGRRYQCWRRGSTVSVPLSPCWHNIGSDRVPASRRSADAPSSASRHCGIGNGCRSSRCIACGPRCPACSASHQQFLRSMFDSRPVRNDRAARRGSTRTNRPAIRAITSSSNSCHRAGSTPWPTATAESEVVLTNTAGFRGGRRLPPRRADTDTTTRSEVTS
jgi:hypothetical protein